MTFWDFFFDPVLRAPTWGCILMCIASSLMGVLIFLRKRSLLSETLSHATYPGVCIGVSLFSLLFPKNEEWVFLAVLLGAFCSSLIALKAIDWLEKKKQVRTDAALCFILSFFFGIGVVIASAMQAEIPVWHKQVQMVLFGQAATMTDMHIAIYAVFALTVSLFLVLAFRPLQAFLFDRDFAGALGIKISLLERILFWLLLLSLIVGIRSVGVVLMSGMAIAPAVAARQFSDRLQVVFFLSALFGALSGLFGNLLSILAPFPLPTGPMIVLVGTSFAIFSLIFAPKRGLLFRIARIFAFRFRCLQENILKGIWKKGDLSFLEIREAHQVSSISLRISLWNLIHAGWLNSQMKQYCLTEDGREKAASIVRLHRLWELYLTDTLGFQAEKVHRTAEEMEHILTPEIEEKLTRLLSNPKQDPHQQPIPEKRMV